MNKIVIIIYLLFIGIPVWGQVEEIVINTDQIKTDKSGFAEAKQNIKTGDSYYDKHNTGGYSMALENYLRANKYNSENAELNYKIGVCYLNSVQKRNALPHLQKAFSTNPTISIYIHYNLGRAYQYNTMFDDAIKEYNLYKKEAKKNGNPEEQKKITKKITECTNGKLFEEYPTDAMVVNLKAINSIYPDYCPLISADESMMILTSRREGNMGGIDKTDGIFYEDIYVSYNKSGLWSNSKNIGTPLNTDTHDATVGLSPDGQQLFLYRDMDIYISNLKGNKWSEPEAMPEMINSPENENSACISFDGNTLFFVRGKTGGTETSNGDIWYSNKKKGIWGTPHKLSSVINSKYDEDGVFLHPDGRTLYFSSKGHNSMGGYDIFRSIRQADGIWSKPENLGFPVNSPDDDIYFVMAANGKKGYYSSVKQDGEGFMDIYEISFPGMITYDDQMVLKQNQLVSQTVSEEKKVKLTIVKGSVTDGNTGAAIEAGIEIFDNSKNETVMNVNSNSSTGNYLVSLPSGNNYGMSVRADNYLFYSENFDISEKEEYQVIEKNIKLYPVKENTKVVLKNIFFDFDKSVLKPESYAELERLKKLMTDNPTLRIELSGHTDNSGKYEHNVQLSKDRAASVTAYLESIGIDDARLTSRGASSDEPIASNDNEKGRQQNRRVEFKIISK